MAMAWSRRAGVYLRSTGRCSSAWVSARSSWRRLTKARKSASSASHERSNGESRMRFLVHCRGRISSRTARNELLRDDALDVGSALTGAALRLGRGPAMHDLASADRCLLYTSDAADE